MRVLHVASNAGAAVSPMLAAIEILAVSGARYFPAARAEGQGWTASAQAAQPQQPQVPRAFPAACPPYAALPAVAVSPEKPAAPPSTKKANARELFRRREGTRKPCGPVDRFLRARLSRRRQAASGERTGLAGHAALAQPQLGPSLADPLHRAFRPGRETEGRLARPPCRRSVHAARWTDAVRSFQPPGRARRRHLV